MDLITRRRFLEQSLLAAGMGITAMGEVPARAGSRSGRPLGANDRIRIALIGVNGRGMDHLKGYVDKLDVDIAAICDPDLTSSPALRPLWRRRAKPKPEAVQDIRELLAMKRSTPSPSPRPITGTRWPRSGRCSRAKMSMSRSPSATTSPRAAAPVEVARKLDRICQAGTQSRSHKACRRRWTTSTPAKSAR